MNTSYKVVFNKARGALMVVNEITSCVQAKGTKTVIATAIASLVSATALAATPVPKASWSDAQKPTSNVIEATPAIPEGDTYPVSLFITSGASGTLTDATISMVANDPSHPYPAAVRAILQRSNDATKVTFDGSDTKVSLTTNYTGSGNSEASAFTNYGGETEFAATNTTITSEATYAEGGKYLAALVAYNVDGKAKILFTGENVALNATSNVDRITDSKDANRRTAVVGAVAVKEAVISSTAKNNTITVNSTGSTVQPADQKLESDGKHYTTSAPENKVGAADAVGLEASGGQINFANQTTITVNANGATATGISAVDSYYTSTTGTVNLDGAGVILDNAKVAVSSQMAAAYGIRGSQTVSDKVLVNIKGDLDLVVTSGKDKARGVFMEGGYASIGSDGKNVKIVANGATSSCGIDADLGSTIDVKGSTISVSAEQPAGRAVVAYDAGTVNLGNKLTESVELKGNDAGIMVIAKGAAVNVEAKKISVTSSNFGVHVQHNSQDAKLPTKTSSITLVADEITVNSKDMGLSAFSNGQMDVTGNLTVTAKNAIDVRGHSLMNINTDGAHATVLNGDVVFETPNTPENDHSSGNLINANVNLGLHGEKSLWTGRAYQEYSKTEGATPTTSVELIAPPYFGNVTDFKVDISKGGKWSVTGDSFVNTLNLTDGGIIAGGSTVKELNVGKLTVTGANNELKLATGTKLNGTITFANADASLITDFVTAYELTTDDTTKAVTDAKAKLTVDGNGGTLVMNDEFVYTSDGLTNRANASIKNN